MENTYIASGESVFELFKVKVIEAVDLAKQISFEEKVAAWQFWTDISNTLKTVTGAENVTVRTDTEILTSEVTHNDNDLANASTKINLNIVHEQTTIPLQTEYNEQIVLCQEGDVTRTAKSQDNVGVVACNRVSVSYLTDSVISPDGDSTGSFAESETINTIDSGQAICTNEIKPKRSRGRPKKNVRQRKSVASKKEVCVDNIEKISMQSISNQEVIKTESETCKLCGQNVDAQSETKKEMNTECDLCTGCGNVIVPKHRQRKKPSRLIEDIAFVCSVCQQIFTAEEELDAHRSTVHNITEEITSQLYPTSEKIYQKESDETLELKPGDSELTGMKRSRRLSLKKSTAITEESHVDEAEEESVGKKARKRQGTSVTAGKLVCHVCQTELSSEAALEVHMRTHSGEKPFSCSVCSKRFTTKCNMQRHEKTHFGEKPFKCEECDKCFTEKKSVKVHMRCHTGEKPYKCEICGRCFSQTGVLRSHMDLHTGHKGHLCDHCGKTFRQRAQLRLHQQRHNNIRTFKCDQCDSCFVTKGDLERHTLKHTGERPYLCTLCPKSFTRLQYLKEHHNIHTGVKPYSCKECDSSFYDLSNFHRHMRKHKTDATSTRTEDKQITVLYTEDQSNKEEVATVLLSTNLESPNTDCLEQISVTGENQTHMSQSIITQNAAGEYELRFIDQPISDHNGVNSEICGSVTQEESGDITQCSNVTFVVKEDEDGSKSLILSAEDLSRLQTDRQASDFSLTAEDVDQTENVENLQPLKVSDLAQLSESFQNARMLSTSSDGQTYHVTYVDSDSLSRSHHILTEDDLSAMNLLPSTTQQL